MTGRPHHALCGSLSVPDVYIECHICGTPTKWCGCMYRCPEHDNAEEAQ